MSLKLQRNYRLQIQDPHGNRLELDSIDKEVFLHLEFETERNTLSSTNTTTIKIKNLSPKNRDFVYRDAYNTLDYWQVVLDAGYGNKLYSIFVGNLTEAFSYKDGPNWWTELHCYDGQLAIQTGYSVGSVAANTSKAQILQQFMTTLPNVLQGLWGADSQGTSPRAQAWMGPTRDLLNEHVGSGRWFVDNSFLHIMDDDEIDGSDVLYLDQEALLTTPQRREAQIMVDTLFVPEARLKLLVEVKSLYPIYNGQYACQGLHHSVMISADEPGTAKTTLTLYGGAGAFKNINPNKTIQTISPYISKPVAQP